MVTSANFAGDYEPNQGVITLQAEKTGSGITKGNVINLSSNKWQTASTSGGGPFGVATKTAAASDSTVQFILKGIVYVVADGVIQPNQPVVVSASTAGQVQSTATPAVDGVVGIYLGHENEGDGETVATAAADGDTIRIWLGGPY